MADETTLSGAPTFGFDAPLDVITAACAAVSEATGQVIQPAVYEVSVRTIDTALILPKWPVLDVLRVRYFDGNGAECDCVPSGYYRTPDDGKTVLRAKVGHMWPNGADRDDAITVTYRAGYDDLPPGLRAMVANLLP